MTFRQRLGLSIPPILLRLVLATAFLWAGLGKFNSVEYTPEQLATLAAMVNASPPAQQPPPPPADNGEPDAAPQDDPDDQTMTRADRAPLILLAQDADADADLDEDPPTNSRFGLYRIALAVHGAATPDDQGARLLPGFLASGTWPIWLAWAAALTELIGGGMILLGLFTRLFALGVGMVMIVAMWMTSIGPVVMLGHPGWPSFMPFLPAVENFSSDAWQTWLLQLSLFGAAFSLVCLGAGPLSLDRFFFSKRTEKASRTEPSADAGD